MQRNTLRESKTTMMSVLIYPDEPATLEVAEYKWQEYATYLDEHSFETDGFWRFEREAVTAREVALAAQGGSFHSYLRAVARHNRTVEQLLWQFTTWGLTSGLVSIRYTLQYRDAMDIEPSERFENRNRYGWHFEPEGMVLSAHGWASTPCHQIRMIRSMVVTS